MIKTISLDQVRLIPQYSEIRSRSDIDTSVSLGRYGLVKLKVPIIATCMETICEERMAMRLAELGALGIIHRFMPIEKQQQQIRNVVDKFGPYSVAAAVGVQEKDKERVKSIIDAGCRFLSFDIAHGHSKMLKDMVSWVKHWYSDLQLAIMGGSITTAEAVRDLYDWGIDIMRVGIGVGSHCTTTLTTGVGIPLFSALQDCVEEKDGDITGGIQLKKNISILVDGGIASVGDICKAIGVGADAAMSGYLFAGTVETPGMFQRAGEFPNERLYKTYRGSASQESKRARGEAEKNIEGVSTTVEHKGKVKRIIRAVSDGLVSSMSYSGAGTIQEFHDKAKFVRI